MTGPGLEERRRVILYFNTQLAYLCSHSFIYLPNVQKKMNKAKEMLPQREDKIVIKIKKERGKAYTTHVLKDTP